MNLKKRVDAIQDRLNPNPQDDARQQELGKELAAARKRVLDSYKREGREIPLCWDKPLEPGKKSIISGHKLNIAEELEAARERLKERCISCPQKEKCGYRV